MFSFPSLIFEPNLAIWYYKIRVWHMIELFTCFLQTDFELWRMVLRPSYILNCLGTLTFGPIKLIGSIEQINRIEANGSPVPPHEANPAMPHDRGRDIVDESRLYGPCTGRVTITQMGSKK